MSAIERIAGRSARTGAAALALLLAGCAAMPGGMTGGVALSGAREVPPVATRASGRARITVAADRTVSGTVTVSGMRAIAAQIREGAAGRNGPAIVALIMTSETSFAVPAGARLTRAQYAAYEKGELYVSVRGETRRGGEIRGQLRP